MLAFIAIVLVMFMCIPGIAFAASQDSTNFTDSAGNYFGVNTASFPQTVQRDAYWVGQTLDATNTDIGNDALAAGQDVTLGSSTVAGSIRTFSQNLYLINTSAGNNLTSIAALINVDKGSKVVAAYLAGQSIKFDGTADTASLSGQDVTFDGTVNGDMNINALNVTIGPDAHVTGSLNVTSPSQPSIDTNAQVGKLNYTQSDGGYDMYFGNSDLAIAIAALISALAMALALAGLIFNLLMALLLCVIIKPTMDRAFAMSQKRLGPIMLTGIIAIIIAPIIAVLLLLPLITSGFSILLFILLFLVSLCCIPFASAILGRRLFKNMNEKGSAVIVSLVATILTFIPIIGWLVNLVAASFTCGYFLQAFVANRKGEFMGGTGGAGTGNTSGPQIVWDLSGIDGGSDK
jgi:hypothetical protein